MLKILVLELDRVLASIRKRLEYATNQITNEINWAIFNDPTLIDQDEIIKAEKSCFDKLLKAGWIIVVITERPKALETETKLWLERYGIPYQMLITKDTENHLVRLQRNNYWKGLMFSLLVKKTFEKYPKDKAEFIFVDYKKINRQTVEEAAPFGYDYTLTTVGSLKEAVEIIENAR